MLKVFWTEDHFTFVVVNFLRADDCYPAARSPCACRIHRFYTASRTDSGKDVIAEHCELWFVNYQADYRPVSTKAFQMIRKDVSDLAQRAKELGRTLGIRHERAYQLCRHTRRKRRRAPTNLSAYGQRDRVPVHRSARSWRLPGREHRT